VFDEKHRNPGIDSATDTVVIWNDGDDDDDNAGVRGSDPLQNARFIVHACNLHDRLVECLRDMLPYAEDFVGRSAQPFKLKAKTDAARDLLAECENNTADTRQKE
jgi:hypothetical protein